MAYEGPHPFPAANGGTGLNGSAAPDGSLLIGNGAGYSLSTLTAGAAISITNGVGSITIAVNTSGLVTSLAGTTNQIAVSSATGASVISLTNGVSLGSYQSITPPTGGIICPGTVGVGTSSPVSMLDTNADTGISVLSQSNTKSAQINVSNATSSNGFITLWSGRSGDAHAALIFSNSVPLRIGSATSVTTSGFSELARITQTGLWGLGTQSPINKLDVSGAVAIGTYAGVNTAPTNGLIVSGTVGIGTATPQNELDVAGSVAVGSYAGSNASSTSNSLIVSGSVGVGTTSPAFLVDAQVTASTPIISLTGYGNGAAPTYYGRRANGTQASPTATAGGTTLASFQAWGYVTGWVGPTAAISCTSDSGFTSTNYGTYMAFFTTADSSTTVTERMRILAGGNVGINTTTPQNQLDVNGAVAIGTYAGANTAPTNGLIVSGNTSIGSSSATAQFNVGSSNQFQVTSLGIASAPEYQLNGATSGTISILSASGTYNFNMPTTAGTGGYLLTSQGGGSSVMTWSNPASIAVTSLQGTANQVLVSGTSGSAQTGAVTVAFPATGGVSIGSYQATTPPTGGIICPGLVGIGTTSPKNALDVAGSVAIGSYAGANSSSTSNSLIVSGSVGVGTTSPAFLVDAQVTASTPIISLTGYGNGAAPTYYGRRANGTQASPTATAGGTTLASFQAWGYVTGWVGPTAAISCTSDSGFTSTNYGTYMAFFTTADSSTTVTERMRILAGGNVGINTTTPQNQLDVNGAVAIGTYAGANTAPTNGLIVSGNTSIGSSSATAQFNVGSSNQFQVTSLGIASAPEYQLNGATSGTISILSASGTYNFNMPTTAGTGGYLLTSQGGGSSVMTWSNPASIAVTSLQGTANQVLVSGTSGSAQVGALTVAFPATAGISIGSYQATTPPTGGIICPGMVGIGFTPPQAQLHVVGPGSATDTEQSICYFGSGSATAGNIYSIVIDKAGTDSVLIGVNKSSATGSVPGSAVFFSSYLTTSTITIGRGNGNALPDFADIYINSTGLIGLSTTSPQNRLDVNGAVAIGSSYAGSATAPTSGAIIQGQLLVGESSPTIQNPFSEFSCPTSTAYAGVLKISGTPEKGVGLVGSADVYGLYVTAGIQPNGFTASNAMQQYIYGTFNASLATPEIIPSTFGLYVGTGALSGGSVTNAFGAYISVPGFGINSNTGLYAGNIAVGAYVGTSPPTNGMMVSGSGWFGLNSTSGLAESGQELIAYQNNSASSVAYFVSQMTTVDNYNLILHTANSSSTSFGGMIRMIASGGTLAAPTALTNGQVIGGIFGAGWDSSSFNVANFAAIRIVTAETWTTSNHGTYIDFAVASTGGAASRTIQAKIASSSSNAGLISLGSSTIAVNTTDIFGNCAIGTYAGSIAAPTSGLIVSGPSAFGTSSANASTEVTISSTTYAIKLTGGQLWNFNTQSATYQMAASDTIVNFSNAGASATYDLPSTVPSAGWISVIVNGSASTLTLFSTAKLNGTASSSVTVSTKNGAFVVTDGTQYFAFTLTAIP